MTLPLGRAKLATISGVHRIAAEQEHHRDR